MSDNETFDFWYALNHTATVLMPTSRLETFGNTVIHYHLVSELMDSVGQVRVREGRMTAERPQILTPSEMVQTLLDGFGSEARDYADWLGEHERQIAAILYGFIIKQEETRSEIVSGNLAEIADRVALRVREAADPLAAVLIGVEHPWQVCLLKLMVDVSQKSFAHNWQALQQRAAREEAERRGNVQAQMDADFARAMEDPSLVQRLGEKLQKLGLFETYQERFFDLIRKHRR